MNNDVVSKLSELTCPFCGGPATTAEFLHKTGCPTHSSPPPTFTITAGTTVEESQEVKLLKQIHDELVRIYHELETIRLRTR